MDGRSISFPGLLEWWETDVIHCFDGFLSIVIVLNIPNELIVLSPNMISNNAFLMPISVPLYLYRLDTCRSNRYTVIYDGGLWYIYDGGLWSVISESNEDKRSNSFMKTSTCSHQFHVSNTIWFEQIMSQRLCYNLFSNWHFLYDF